MRGFRNGSYISLTGSRHRQAMLEKVPRLAKAVGMNPAELVGCWIKHFAPSAWDGLQTVRSGAPE